MNARYRRYPYILPGFIGHVLRQRSRNKRCLPDSLVDLRTAGLTSLKPVSNAVSAS
jgi:hypothetical protein